MSQRESGSSKTVTPEDAKDAVSTEDSESTEDAASAEDAKPTAPPADAKAKFREALERKKAANHPTADGAANTGSVHGPETNSGAPKMFRRRAGAS